MVKTAVGDETQFKSTEDRLFNSTNLPTEVGLVIGKLNPILDRAFIFDLIPTPPNDNSQPASSLSSSSTTKPNTKKASKSNPSSSSLLLDTEWIIEHAHQVSQMLLGGIHVIGIYIWSPESSFNLSTASLLQVSKDVSAFPEQILVHFCYSPRKLIVRSSAGNTSSFRICDFNLGKVLNSLKSFKCLYNFHIRLPISGNLSFREVIREGIIAHGKEMRNARAVINGNLVIDDQLGVSDSSHTSHNVELLLPIGKDCVGEVKEEVVGIVVFSGFICSIAYLSPKETIAQAISDIKGDIITSLQSRLNIICDDGEEEDMGETGDGEKEILTQRSMAQLGLRLLKKPTSLAFPRRVLVPWRGDVFVCDYLQSSETNDVVKDHCKELLSMGAPTDNTSLMLEPEKEAISFTMKSFWDVAVSSYMVAGINSNSLLKREIGPAQKEMSNTSVMPVSFSTVTAFAVLLFAVVIGFLFYSSR